MGGKESGNVLNEHPSSIGENSVSDSGELEEEAGSGAGESSSSTGDREVLAGESSTEEVKTLGAMFPRPVVNGGV